MQNRSLAVITGEQVSACLRGKETEIVQIVRRAYEWHATGKSVLPENVYLRFPDVPSNRIIAKAGFLAEPFQVAGMKWIASFPANITRQIDRASAVIVLNSAHTGRPEFLLEGSVISACRTAASAVLAADTFLRCKPPECVALIGCGVICFETLRYLVAAGLRPGRVVTVDLEPQRAIFFVERVRERLPDLRVTIESTPEAALRQADLICFGTSAGDPFLQDPSVFRRSAVILHISLRDLGASIIMACDNVVDDVAHVCSAGTSLHLAEQQAGNRGFIRCTLGEILIGKAEPRAGHASTIFSPFGLAVLDLAVAQWVSRFAVAARRVHWIPDFLAAPWRSPAPSVNSAVATSG